MDRKMNIENIQKETENTKVPCFAKLYNRYVKENHLNLFSKTLQKSMLNINYGHNRELMQKCRRLEEYATFVLKVREHAARDPKNLERKG